MIWVLGSTRRRLRSTVPDHLKEGRKLLAQGAYDAALAELNKALEISPYLGEAYYQRGCVHEARGRIDEALADFDHALQCDPQHAHAYLHRGRIRTEKGDLEPALADFDQVMIMRPNDAECYLQSRGLPGQEGPDQRRDPRLPARPEADEPFRLLGTRPLLPRTARRREPAGSRPCRCPASTARAPPGARRSDQPSGPGLRALSEPPSVCIIALIQGSTQGLPVRSSHDAARRVEPEGHCRVKNGRRDMLGGYQV